MTVALVEAFIIGKRGNYAVLRGSNLRMSCIPRESDTREERDTVMTYTWTDDKDREVVDARFTKFENGDLEIVNAHVSDSGIYKCKPETSPSTSTAQPKNVYEHKLVVYELSGHKFVTRVFISMSMFSQEIMITMLTDLLKTRVCNPELCSPGNIKVEKCQLSETKQEVCEFSIAYEAFGQMAEEQCTEACIRARMYDGLKKAEKILQKEFLRLRESPRGRIKADLTTFETHHLITCRAGFHLVKSHYKRCFPCLPGYYSEANSVECQLCNIGYYQEKYGKHECNKCEKGKTTDTMGAKNKGECVSTDKVGILGNIKQSLAALFTG
ncbi:ig-like domain-containing protein [Trichonephila inaurata madagascariensis]|uniref:Ig-like domain-containing protein n=1 Tax=Trichonephila inaurata madagascariensis TaxID=2747483 RepID=A0A8X6Y0Y1_9ARAC|nr:ig-like domain-containing protein [Trichonephila inaurata madagascariensis]